VDEKQEIDAELWLNFLLAQMGDEHEKQALIAKLSHGSGVTPDKVEEVLHSLAGVLLDIARSN
jgi:hypothetical protein